ncbi:hypothetical protein ACOL3J_11315, partial [Aliarcobacter butzleri]
VYILFALITIITIWLFNRFTYGDKLRTLFFNFTFIFISLRFTIPIISYVKDVTYNYFEKPQDNIEVLNVNIVKVTDDVSNIN